MYAPSTPSSSKLPARGRNRYDRSSLGGSADRYALGWLVAYRAYIDRSWNPAVRPEPLALVAPGQDQPNTRTAYDALGIDIVPVGEGAPQGGRGQSGGKNPWDNPATGEDRALHAYWQNGKRKGWWLAEVPIGAGVPRRLDAVVIRQAKEWHSPAGQDLDDFQKALEQRLPVEPIEAKRRPDEEALGQLLAAKYMFRETYPGAGDLSLTACVWKQGSEPARWLYKQHPSVHVETIPESQMG